MINALKIGKWTLWLTVASLGLVVLLIYALAQPKIDNTRTANLVLGPEPSSLDPAISLTIDARAYLSNMFAGLMSIGPDGSLKPAVASNLVINSQQTVYTFTIRNIARWSDGSAVTANDFKYSWLRVLDPSTASGWASYLYYIKGAKEYNSGNGSVNDVGINVINDNTLEVTLVAPNSFFGSMTALQAYFPVQKKTIEENGQAWSTKAETYISNGAYKLASWGHDTQIVLVRNDQYWDRDNVHLAQIDFKLLSDPNSIMSAFQSKDLAYVSNVLTVDQMSQVSDVHYANYVYTKFLSPNLDRAAMKDDRVREAITLAIDRNVVAKTISGSQALLSFIPSGFMNTAKGVDFRTDGYKTQYLSAEADQQRAAQLLLDAGYSTKQPLSLVYLTNTSGANVALAELIKNQLEKVGISIEIQAYESKVFNSYRKERKYDLVAASWAAEYPDISSYLYGLVSTDTNNYPGYKNTQYDDLYQNLLKEPEGAQKYLLAHQAEDLLMNDRAVFPLYYLANAYITDSSLTGYYQDSTGTLILQNAYFNK